MYTCRYTQFNASHCLFNFVLAAEKLTLSLQFSLGGCIADTSRKSAVLLKFMFLLKEILTNKYSKLGQIHFPMYTKTKVSLHSV